MVQVDDDKPEIVILGSDNTRQPDGEQMTRWSMDIRENNNN